MCDAGKTAALLDQGEDHVGVCVERRGAAVARARQVDPEIGDDASRMRGEHYNAVGELDRLLAVVRHDHLEPVQAQVDLDDTGDVRVVVARDQGERLSPLGDGFQRGRPSIQVVPAPGGGRRPGVIFAAIPETRATASIGCPRRSQ